MKLSRSAAAGAAALAVAGLVCTAPSASAADTQWRHAFQVSPGATVTATQTCPAGAPYLVRTGFRAEYGTGVAVTKQIRRDAAADGWVVTATNTGTEEATVTAAYSCSTTATTYPRWNNAWVRSTDTNPLNTSIGCPSGYPYFDTGTAVQGDTKVFNYVTPDFEAVAGVPHVTPIGFPQKIELTFRSSYPITTHPSVIEWIRFDWVCSR
ncbi:hypothetical protein AB0B89_01570 [Sphaerisporangium sp. NPDC049002]|uniref:hypothetical protein n=1 Tax=unclassified Sphaerisporangium TaxID=2630420 RepID=UPI0033F7919B